jgi:hypothetical protein
MILTKRREREKRESFEREKNEKEMLFDCFLIMIVYVLF